MKHKKKDEISNWIKLDNAALIYPSTLSRKYASMFRMTVTLDEEIDKELLDKALKKVLVRFPSFGYELKKGLFWYYLKKINDFPDIGEDYQNPMLRINFKKNKKFMFRIRYFDKRIAIEYFHALTDGFGGMTFLLSLTGEYLHLKKHIKISYNKNVWNPLDVPNKDEYSDRFFKYARKNGSLEHEKSAFHIKGIIEPYHIIHIITGTVLIDDIKKVCHQYNATITEFIASIMLDSIQEIREQNIKNNKLIKVSIPVNLRNYYDTNTMRNFSSYVNVGIDPKYGHYSFEEIIKIVKNSMELMITEKRLNAKITGNVKLQKNIFVRLLPMFIKKYIMSFCERIMGDRYWSSTLSNLGLIVLPKEMEKYIDKLGFILGRQRGNSGTCSCVGCNDKIYISFSRRIKEATLERLFFTKLVEMGIPVEIESNLGGYNGLLR